MVDRVSSALLLAAVALTLSSTTGVRAGDAPEASRTAGLGGGELVLGYGSLIGETGSGAWLLRRVFVGYGVRAAVLRTWGLSTRDSPGETFLGVEGAMTIAQFGMRLGVFHRVETVPGQSDWRVFGGAGWGF